MNASESLPPEQFCYLTTTSRVSGKPHTVEIWFAASPYDQSIYILAGGGHRSDWVKNIDKDNTVSVRIADRIYAGKGRIVESEEESLLARKLVVAKYYNREYNPEDGWEATALPVAIDLEV